MAAFHNYLSTLLLFINIPYSLLARVVNRPPHIITQPNPIPYRNCAHCVQGDRVLVHFKEGDTITLTCRASGLPIPEYTWTKNGQEIDFSSPDYISPTTNITRIVSESLGGSLTIEETSDFDVGLYQCSAYNKLGRSLSKKVQVIKAVNEPFPSVTIPKRVNVLIGNSVVLTCNPPLSIPKAIVYWTGSDDGTGSDIDPSSAGSRIPQSNRVVMDYTGNLYFANVIAADNRSGEAYVCNAWQKSVFRSFLQGEDKIIDTKGAGSLFQVSELWNSDKAVTGLMGETVKFMCIFAGNPTPKITWRRLGTPLDANDRVYVGSTGHELIIKNVMYTDQGQYECEGHNDLARGIKVRFTLTVQSKPSWATPPVNQDVGVMEDATFQCIPEGLPEPMVEWFINGKPIDQVPATRRILRSGVLTFENLEQQDYQVIQCLATNKHGSLWADVYLNVLAYGPEISLGPGMQTVAEGQTVTLNCENDGKPQPTLTWKKGAQILKGARYTETLSSLTIVDVTSSDDGTYTCTATNVYDSKSSTGSLTVRRRTRILTAPLDKEVTYGSAVAFACTAHTDNAELENLHIEWLKDDVPLDNSDPNIEISSDGIRIEETSSADTANYTCWAHNRIDEAKSVAELKVRAPPDPGSIVILNCDARKVSLRWTKSRDNFSPIQRYIVEQHNSFNPGVWTLLKETDGSVTEVEAKLSAWVNYTFRVKAVNDMGEGKPTEPTGTICKTQKDYPDKHPANVQIIDSKPSFLIIQWDEMPPIEHNAPGFKYRLEVTNKKTGNVQKFVIDDYQETRKEIQTDNIYQEYEIYVMAVNEKGDAVPMPLTNVGHSGMSVPLVVPQNFEQDPDFNITYEKAGFRWDPVDESPETMQGKFDGYKIRYWRTDNPDKKSEVIVRKEFIKSGRRRRATDKVTALVENLPAFTLLQMDVVAINTFFESNSSNVLNVSTPEGVPGTVQQLHATNRGVVHIMLAWTEPERPNGKITGYEVSYEEIDGLTISDSVISNDTILELNGGWISLVNGLNENTQYRIHVQAKTVVGLGEDMFIDVMTATPGDPAVPKIERVTPHFDAINVSWTLNSNHERAGYKHFVEYRRQGNHKWKAMTGELMKSWQLVPNLTSGVTYEVQVAATSGKETKRSTLHTVVTLGAQVAHSPKVYESLWFIIMLVALALVIFVFIVVCLVKRNRGDKYHVQENERLKGIPPEDKKSAHVNDFNENGEKQPLAGGSDPDLEKAGLDSEKDSLEEYGDVDPSRFNEDGSFIGQYGAQNVSTADEAQPSAMHTFV